MTRPAANLDEIRRLLPELPGPDLEAGSEAARRVADRGEKLGRLAEIAAWLATWQASYPPRVAHPRTALFAARHGVESRLEADPGETAARVARCIAGDAAVNRVCSSIDADLRVYEMALEHPTADFTEGPAMGDEECARAAAYGMMAVEPGVDLLVLGDIGGGSTAAATSLAALLFGGAASDWLGPAAEPGLVEAVAAAIARHRGAGDPFEMLRRVGGPDLAAIAGAVMAARLARVPVVLDGLAATAAAAVVFAADRRALDHCLAAQLSSAPGHARLLKILGAKPLLDLELPTGEGVAGTLAVTVLRAAIVCNDGAGATAMSR
jgi:nicotinate-nucleotide--dimethylbenzimidazole phosphoribosyltransferase